MNHLAIQFGLHGDLIFQCIAQWLNVPFGAIMTATQLGKDRIEDGVIPQLATIPDRSGSAFKGSDLFHLWPTQSGSQGFWHQWPQGLNGISHFGNHAVAEPETSLSEQLFQLALRQALNLHLAFEEMLCFEYGQRFINERQTAAELVFAEVGKKYIGLLRPGLDDAIDPAKSLIAGFVQKLLQYPQPCIAATVEHIIGSPRLL